MIETASPATSQVNSIRPSEQTQTLMQQLEQAYNKLNPDYRTIVAILESPRIETDRVTVAQELITLYKRLNNDPHLQHEAAQLMLSKGFGNQSESTAPVKTGAGIAKIEATPTPPFNQSPRTSPDEAVITPVSNEEPALNDKPVTGASELAPVTPTVAASEQKPITPEVAEREGDLKKSVAELTNFLKAHIERRNPNYLAELPKLYKAVTIAGVRLELAMSVDRATPTEEGEENSKEITDKLSEALAPLTEQILRAREKYTRSTQVQSNQGSNNATAQDMKVALGGVPGGIRESAEEGAVKAFKNVVAEIRTKDDKTIDKLYRGEIQVYLGINANQLSLSEMRQLSVKSFIASKHVRDLMVALYSF